MQDVRILVVEDEPLVAQDIRLNLEMLDWVVVGETASGREAVTLAGKLRPDLVLMDILLAGDMDGIQAATRIATEYDIPVIYLTAYADEDYLQRAKITDPLGYILKPFTQRELQAVITLALHRSKNERSLQTFLWGSSICDSARDAVIVVDVEMRLSLLNCKAVELLGVDSDALLGQSWDEDVLGLQPLSKLGLEKKLQRAVIHGEVWEGDDAVGFAAGDKQIYIQASVAPVYRRGLHIQGAMLILRDVSIRIKAEQAALNQLARLSQYLEVSGAMMVALDLEGKVILANPAACAVLGYAEAELLGSDWFKTCIPSRLRRDARSVFERIIQASRDVPAHMEARVLTRSGEERMIFWNLAPLKDIDSQIIGGLGSGVDITVRKRLEDAIGRSRDFYLSLLQHLPILVWRADAMGQCDYFNDAWLTFTGRTLQEEAGNGWLDAVHPDDVEPVMAANAQAFDRREPLSITYRLRSQDGTYHALMGNAEPIYDVNGEFSGYIGGCVDIEVERQAERDLRRVSRALQVLSRVNETLVRAGNSSDFLQSVCNIIVEGGDYRMAWVGLAEQDRRRSVRPVAAAGIALEALAERVITWADDAHGQGPTGRAIRLAEPAIMREPSEKSYEPWREYAEEYGYASSVALPIRRGSDVVGALNIYAREPDAFDQDELSLLVNLADDLSFGLDVQHKEREIGALILRNDAILRAVREGFWVLSLSDRIVEVNEAYCVLSGYTPQELQRMSATELTDEAYRVEMTEHLGVVKRKGYDCFETRLINKRGGFIDVELSATLAGADEDSFVFAFLRDISSRKRAEKDLLESETKFRALFEVANDAIFLMQDDLFVDCNERTLAMFGCSREQIIDQPPYRFSPEYQPDGRASKDKARDLIAKAFSGEPMFFEWKHCRYDGQIFDAEVSLNRVRISGETFLQAIVRDITDRKVAERALADAHHYLEALYQVSPDMIFLHAADGRLVDVNQNALSRYGYTREEMLNLGAGDLSAPRHTKIQVEQMLKRALAGEAVDFEWVARHKNGSEFPVEIRLRRLAEVASPLQAALVAMVRDMSTVKRVEAQLRAILDFSPALICTKDLKGRLTMASRQLEVLSKVDGAGLIGRSLYELFPRDVADAAWALDQKAIVSGQPVLSEETLRHLDGSEHVYLAVRFPLFDSASDKPFAVGLIATDITTRKNDEIILKQERDFSEAIFNTIGSVVVVIDRGGSIVRFNEAAQRLTGYSEGEILGRRVWDDLLVPEQIESVRAVFEDLTAGNFANQHVNYWVTKAGDRRLLDWNNTILTDGRGSVEYIIATGIDITDKLLAQEDLAKVETQWNHAIDFFADPLYFVDLQDKVIRANAAFYKLTGLSPEQAIGRNIVDIMHPQGETVPCPVCAARRARQDAFIVMEADHPDNPIKKPIEIAVRMIRAQAEAEPTGILLSLRDLTQQRKIEAEIRRHRDHLEELVKERTQELEEVNRELEAFSYSVSHDLRAPLRSVDGFSQVLAEEYADCLDERGRDYLKRVRASSQRMGHLIDDLLMLSRVNRQDLHRQPVDLERLAHTMLDALHGRDPERKVDFDVQDGIRADVDLRLIKIVIENLLGNAWKFTGKESISEIKFGKCLDQGQEVFFIKDNGVGFDMAFADRMFDAFQRLHTDQEFEGTGVGLATVQRIVHRHGGRIYARSEPGKGATFYFTFPSA